MFVNDNGQGADFNQAGQEQQQLHHHPMEDFADHAEHQQDEELARRGSRPQSMNILPESLTSVNNHAFHKEETAKVERVERTRRLSEEERHAENFPNDAAPPTPTSPSAAALGTGSAVSPTNTRIPAALSLGRAAGARFGRSGSGGAGSLAQMSPTTPTATNPYGSLNGRTAAGAAAAVAAGGTGSRLTNVPHRLSLTGTTAAFARQQLDEAAQASPSTPTQAQYLSKLSQPTSTTLSRSGTRSSPPTSAGLRRPGFATQQDDYNGGGGSGGSALPSPTEQYDDYYRAEKEFQMQQQQQQSQPPVRSSYLRQQQQKQQQQQQDLEQPEWYDNNDEDHQQPRRIPTIPMKSSRTLPPAPLSLVDQQQQLQREQREQRDQKHLQRLRIQQQALEEVYGHGSGYGSNYPDDQGGFIDDHHRVPPQQGQARYQAQLSPRHHRDQRDDHFRSSMLASPPLPPSPRDYHSATVNTPRASSIQQHQQSRYSPPMQSSALPSLTSLPPRASEHYRRQSKDGYSLMSAPRISPPLTGLPTSSARTPSSSQLANPRRSLSQGLSGASTLPSRRLSTTASVGNDGLSSTGSGIGMGLHGRSGSSGSLQRSNTYASQPLPSAGGRGATGGIPSLYSDGNLPSVAGSRRTVSSMMSNGAGGGGLPLSSRRSASDSMGGNVRASSNSEYARVFNPNPPPPPSPHRSSIPSAGGNHYQHQQQQDSYTYRPEVPLRQSSLGAGGMASGIGGSAGSHLSSRSSIATLRSGSTGSLHGLSAGGSGSIPSSASQLRRAASMNVSAGGGAGGHNGLGIGMGGGGTASLGRAGGMMSAAATASRQSYQPQGMQSQQMQMPQQRYQRTSMYSHRS